MEVAGLSPFFPVPWFGSPAKPSIDGAKKGHVDVLCYSIDGFTEVIRDQVSHHLRKADSAGDDDDDHHHHHHYHYIIKL
jgi:hypothetical protein